MSYSKTTRSCQKSAVASCILKIVQPITKQPPPPPPPTPLCHIGNRKVTTDTEQQSFRKIKSPECLVLGARTGTGGLKSLS